MSIPGFGNILPIHGHILALIGWRLSRGGSELVRSEPQRLEQMRSGHAELVRLTRQDFGYDLAKWREFLLAHDEAFGYRHPYAFASVDRAVKAALSEADFPRLAELAAAGGREWDAEYDAKLAREEQARMHAITAKDALITRAVCPFCGKPCPTYCGKRVRPPY